MSLKSFGHDFLCTEHEKRRMWMKNEKNMWKEVGKKAANDDEDEKKEKKRYKMFNIMA